MSNRLDENEDACDSAARYQTLFDWWKPFHTPHFRYRQEKKSLGVSEPPVS